MTLKENMEQNFLNKTYLGVEIGGTKQQIAIGNERGELIEKRKTITSCRDGAIDILSWIEKEVNELVKKYEGSIQKIGVGFGGPLDSKTGKVLSSLQVEGWKDFQLKRWFEEHFHLPVIVLNDTVAGGFGELYLGAGRESKHFFIPTLERELVEASILKGKFMMARGKEQGISEIVLFRICQMKCK